MGIKIQSISSWPSDFQQILVDLLCETHSDQDEDWESVIVTTGDIRDHMIEWDENESWWEDSDRVKVDHYAERMRLGDTFPPLIVDAPRLLMRDGYHRMGAYLKNGIFEAPIIYLNFQENRKIDRPILA